MFFSPLNVKDGVRAGLLMEQPVLFEGPLDMIHYTDPDNTPPPSSPHPVSPISPPSLCTEGGGENLVMGQSGARLEPR